MESIHPCLWFDNNALEAAEFYTGIFPDSRILNVTHYSKDMPMPASTVLTVDIEIRGVRLMLLNGGPLFQFNESISLVCPCANQAEIDEFWDKLLSGGGQPVQCGWLKDRFGVSWQVSPAGFGEMFANGTEEQRERWMAAMMPMVKLDINVLMAAWNG
ncbi:MAG: VOC family protein [Planctomycetales bacterium]|nr:VOC family protein [bacterium]UNM08879.1 MAG: VOC family protein [Planctomycetales bacterium]